MNFLRGSGPSIRVLHSSASVFVASAPTNAFSMNMYIVGCHRTKTAAFLDCGEDKDLDRWFEFAEKQHGFKVNSILQTHSHCDHIAGLRQFQDRMSNPPVYAHKDDCVWWPNPFGGLPGASAMFPHYKPPTEEGCVWVADGDKVRVGDLEFSVISVPGHTPGQVVFYTEPEGKDETPCSFVGDLIFAGSVGRTDLPHSEPEKMQPSLRKVCQQCKDSTIIFSGHGHPTQLGAEKRTNMFLR